MVGRGLLFVLLIPLLTHCSGESGEERGALTTFSSIAMTMHYRIAVGHPLDERAAREVAATIDATFDEVDSIYNIWNPDSELSRLNRAKGGEWLPLSPQLEGLLLFTDSMVKLTGGAFDPTITPAYQLWVKRLKENMLPTGEEIAKLRDVVGWDKVALKEQLFRKERDAVAIDLGGVAKGYCVDLLLERIVDLGYSSCYVEWGGEIRTHGLHPEKRPWRVYISHLAESSPDKALAVVDMVDDAIATSGDYLQQWSYSGGEGPPAIFSHVIDPRTLQPIRVGEKNICSATVMAETCALADALATALLLSPSLEEADEEKKKWGSERKISCWYVNRNSLSPHSASP